MPTIIPSYVYTLFASLIVGAILICACGLSTVSVRHDAERQQLANITEYVVTKSLELTSGASTNNLTSILQLNMPSSIGNQPYWVQISNDSSGAWVEVGFGTTVKSSEQRKSIPLEVFAEGLYMSGSGNAQLECYKADAAIYLRLSGGG